MHQGHSEEAIPLPINLHLTQGRQIKVIDYLWVNFLPEKEATDNCDQA
jgi:hypothetical protein